MAEETKTEPTPETPPPAPEKKAETPRLQVDAAEYVTLVQKVNELTARLDEVQKAKDQAVEDERKIALAKLAEEKGIQAALEEQRRQLQADRDKIAQEKQDALSRWLTEKRDAEVARSLAGKTFVSDAAKAQAMAILNARFESALVDGTPVVRDATTKRPAAEVLPGLVDSVEFAHFYAASGRNGSGTTGTNQPPPRAADDANLTPAQRALRRAAELAASLSDGGAIGLRPTK